MIIAHGLVWVRWVISLMCARLCVRAHTHMHTQRHKKSVRSSSQARTPNTQARVYAFMCEQGAHEHARTHAVTSPGHPNNHSVRWIYCKQSRQEDDRDGVFAGFSGLASDFRTRDVQRVHVV